MKIESQTPSFLTNPHSDPDIASGEAIHQRSVETAKMASKIIFSIGASLTAACIIGIWALPLDLVIYSASVKVLAIPASLLALPIVFVVCGIAVCILNRYLNAASAADHPILLTNYSSDDNLNIYDNNVSYHSYSYDNSTSSESSTADNTISFAFEWHS